MPAPKPSLTHTDVNNHVRSHCFSSDAPPGRVGVEIELLTAVPGDGNRRPTAAELFAVVAGPALPERGRVTVEPGGQVELSSLPRPGPAAAIAATSADLDTLRSR